jgi:hypothetical protein
MPKFIFFKDWFINTKKIVSISVEPKKVSFYTTTGVKVFTDFDEIEYKELIENLQSLL